MSSHATNPTNPTSPPHRAGRAAARVIPLRPARPTRQARDAEATASGATAPATAPAAAPAPGTAPTAPGPAPKEPLWRHLVGNVLRRERRAQERTLKDVADAARISVPYLSEVERGRKEASSEVLAAAAAALGLDLADLLALAHGELLVAARRPRSRDQRAATAAQRPATAPQQHAVSIVTTPLAAPHGTTNQGSHQARLRLAA